MHIYFPFSVLNTLFHNILDVVKSAARALEMGWLYFHDIYTILSVGNLLLLVQ